jgi:hypothetical protein
MKDVYLIMMGRKNVQDQQQFYLRHHAAIVSHVFNSTMGGPGAFKSVLGMWKLDGDTESKPMTNEERKAIIERYNQRRKK